MTHHGVSQMLHFSEMSFFVVFGDKKVSRILESYVGICGSWPVQAYDSHVTKHVFFVTEYKKCTQTMKIIPYRTDNRRRRGIRTSLCYKCKKLILPYLVDGSDVKNVWDLRRNEKNTSVDKLYYSYIWSI